MIHIAVLKISSIIRIDFTLISLVQGPNNSILATL